MFMESGITNAEPKFVLEKQIVVISEDSPRCHGLFALTIDK